MPILSNTHSLLNPPNVAIKLVLARLLLLLPRLSQSSTLGEKEQDSTDRLRNEGKELGVETEQVLEGQRGGGQAEGLRPLYVSLSDSLQIISLCLSISAATSTQQST